MTGTRSRIPAAFVLVASLALFALPIRAFAQVKVEAYRGHEVAANSVLVKFRKPITASAMAAIKQAEGIDHARAVGGIGVQRLHSRTKNVAALMASLSTRPNVEYVEPDYRVQALATPGDPSFGLLWGLRNTGQSIGGVTGIPGADISAVPAWDISEGSSSNVVAVVDTGVDYTHPDLAANIWTAPAAFTVSIGGTQVHCAAGTHGFNAILDTCDPMDDNGHGTHVSGTIGAVGGNGRGVVGVEWRASIMGDKFLDASGNGFTSDAIDAIEFAIQVKATFGNGANVRVLSNSWGGGPYSQALADEISRANANDMLFVAAAGNSSNNNDVYPEYPASYSIPNVIAVAATDNRDQLASFSNYGSGSVDLGAPGVNVYSTLPGNAYGFMSGTSMATPQVSGAAALVLSVCGLGTAGLKADLLNSVDPLTSLAGLTITGGRLNVNTAIRSCVPASPPPGTNPPPWMEPILNLLLN